MSRTKSSSGDKRGLEKYVQPFIGETWITWDIIRKGGKVTVTEPYPHKL